MASKPTSKPKTSVSATVNTITGNPAGSKFILRYITTTAEWRRRWLRGL